MKPLFYALTTLLSVCTFSVTNVALAQNATQIEESWVGYPFNLTIIGTQGTTQGEALATTSEEEPGALFICLGSSFRVSISLTPQNIRKNYRKASRSFKGKYVDMKLDDGKKISLGHWAYAPDTKIIRASKHASAAKLYNAAIRQQQVTLYVSGKKPVILNLPKPNAAFADFGAECGIGRNKPK